MSGGGQFCRYYNFSLFSRTNRFQQSARAPVALIIMRPPHHVTLAAAVASSFTHPPQTLYIVVSFQEKPLHSCARASSRRR